jgi:hypothetical protein
MRSQTIDRLNLIEYILDPQHKSEFEFVPQGPDLGELHAGISMDMEVIAAAASFAINNPKKALNPEIYAREKMKIPNYILTLLPTNLPAHNGATIVVPDFINLASMADVSKLAGDNVSKPAFEPRRKCRQRLAYP